jgi:hypothetical protein
MAARSEMDIVDAIAIRGDGTYGMIRCESGPDLIACRPEPFRFERLLLVAGAAMAMAETELGPGSGGDLFESLNALSDAKGDFSIYWKDQAHLDRYEPLVNNALLLWGEDDVLHYVGHSSFGAE